MNVKTNVGTLCCDVVFMQGGMLQNQKGMIKVVVISCKCAVEYI